MAENQGQHARKLAVLLHADVAGSTQLVQINESLAHDRITDTFSRFSQVIGDYGGTVHEVRGDALIAEFTRASDAVSAALVFQKTHGEHLDTLVDKIVPRVRVGVSLGEVVFADRTVTGAGIVLAQRVEQLADPGGACITAAIREALPERMPFVLSSLGEQSLKGFADSIGVYRVTMEPGKDAPLPEPEAARSPPTSSGWKVAAVITPILLVSLVGVWWLSGKPIWESEEARTGKARTSKPSVVVLPFDNISNDPEQGYFADGMSEDITTHLSKIGELFVISRNSAFAYKGKNLDARHIAQELGVRYLLEGSVRRAGEQIRVNAQLIDGNTGNHLWAEIYNSRLDDVFGVQDRLTAQIVKALKVHLTDAEKQRVYSAETDSAEAYDAFLRGWEFFSRNTSEDLPHAKRYFEKALILDPDYSRASAAAAAVYHKAVTEQWYTLRLDDAAMMRALRSNLDHAMRDPNSLAHVVAAQLDVRRGKVESAARHARTAVELEPNSALSHSVLGRALLFAGRHKEALEKLDEAIRLDPHNTSDNLGLSGLARFLVGESEVALKLLEESQLLHPERSSAGAEVTLAAVYADLGHQEEAKRQVKTIQDLWEEAFWVRPDIPEIMTQFPFRKAVDAERFVSNLLAAGLCCEQDLYNVLQSKHE